MNSTDSKSAFKRNFFIFTNEDTGFEAGQKPSGHVKVEVRGTRGKLHAVAQNLRPGNGRFDYILYILRSGDNAVEPIRAGRMENKFSRWELEWTFDPDKLGIPGYPADDCDLVAILAEFADRQGGRVICPLAAYRNKPVEWRSGFSESKTGDGEADARSNKENGCGKGDYDGLIRIDSVLGKSEHEEDATNYGINNGIGDAVNEGINVAAIEMKAEGQDNNNDAIDTDARKGVIDEGSYSGIDSCNIDGSAITESSDIGSINNAIDTEASSGDVGRDNAATNVEVGCEEARISASEDTHEAVSKSNAGTNNIDTTCIYLNGNMCAALIQPEGGIANPCGACQIRQGVQPANARLPADMARLEKIFDSNFERSDPFQSNRSDYTWWKVTNPVNLNNILYLNSIHSPLLFNPAVMVAHYKYRHFIIGVFTHMDGQKYLVCGVPGMHMVDRKPFGQLGTWVQTEGNRQRYGAFGYWLVYINPDDGKMLSINRE